MGLKETVKVNPTTLAALGLNAKVKLISTPVTGQPIRNQILEIGGSVHIRTGPGTVFPSIAVAHESDAFESVDVDGWQPILLGGEVHWISGRYCKASSEVA